MITRYKIIDSALSRIAFICVILVVGCDNGGDDSGDYSNQDFDRQLSYTNGDIGCGRDTDRSGVVDNWCPGDDLDNDGYSSSEGDCSDQDFDIFPGTTWSGKKVGCESGSYRTCRADGSGFTECTPSSSVPYCPRGDFTTSRGKSANVCYYFDAQNGDDSSGDGSWDNPWKSPAKISDQNEGDHFPSAGEAFVFKYGRYSEVSDEGRFVLNLRATGTAEQPIWIVGYPPEENQWARFEGGIQIIGSNFVIGRGFEITQGSQMGDGIYIAAGAAPTDYNDWALNYIHDKVGESANNIGCIVIFQGGTGNYIHHNFVSNCLDPNLPDLANGAGIIAGQQNKGVRVEYNNIIQIGPRIGACIHEKHLEFGSDGSIKGNYCSNADSFLKSSGGYHRTVMNNLSTDCLTGIALFNSAGPTYFGGLLAQNNTLLCDNAVVTAPAKSHNRDWTATGIIKEECGADTPPWDESIFRYNVIQSRLVDFRAQIHGEYQSDLTYHLWHSANAWVSYQNGYFSTGSDVLKYRMFASNNGCTEQCCESGILGEEYVGLSEIQNNGYESGSIQENPQLDVRSIATNPRLAGWGYR